MYLVSLNKNGTFVLAPEIAKMEPSLAKLTEEELLAVILAYDYFSVYRQLPEHERLRRAHTQVFKAKRSNFWTEPKIIEAVNAYMGCQYDERREQVKTYQVKIALINESIRISDSPTAISNHVKTNKELRAALNEMEEELMMDEEKDLITIKGKGQLSFLAKIMRNKEKYKEITAKRTQIAKKEKIKEASDE